MVDKFSAFIVLVLLVCLITGCATRITGSVKLMDDEMKPMSKDDLKGIVVNVINTSSSLNDASYTLTTDNMGKFASEKGVFPPGVYKIEVGRRGYKTATVTVDLGKFRSERIDLTLTKIQQARTKTIRANDSDADKIINPGEVNIQPPFM